MVSLDRPDIQSSTSMGAVEVTVKLTNALDEELVKRGLIC